MERGLWITKKFFNCLLINLCYNHNHGQRESSWPAAYQIKNGAKTTK